MFELMLCLFDSFSIRLSASWRVRRHLSLHRYQIPDPHKVISRYRKLEYPPDLRNTPMAQLPEQSHRLQPPKYFFYSFPFPLADCVSAVPCCSRVDRAAPVAFRVLCYVRRDVHMPAFGCEIPGVVTFVCTHRSYKPASC